MKEIRGFKGFDKNLKCQGFQYEFGKPYETDKAVMCEIGYRGHASAVGYYGHASAAGDYGRAEVSGKNSIACGIGIHSKARGKIGCWIILADESKSCTALPHVAIGTGVPLIGPCLKSLGKVWSIGIIAPDIPAIAH